MTDYTMTVEQPVFTMSLSRTGGQGSKGDSVTNAVINNDADLIVTITKADGTTYDINAGNLEATIDLGDLPDFEIVNKQDGDVLIYDASNSKYENHQLTTTKLLDVDNTGKVDGAVLVYNNSVQKYQATNRIEKETTHIIGGSF